tara:strand:- start:30448 stop:31224 length:777 start_codon:yes stop_codon:yes gene_type:complete
MQRWNSLIHTVSGIERRNHNRIVINRAYHKMHEIAMSCVLPFVTTSIHLCEAPGGFVQCVADHMRSPSGNWSWRAVTLENGIPVDGTHLPNDCGCFLFANVLTEEEHVVAELRSIFIVFEKGGVDLVTADGAVAMNHSCLEEEHLPLARSQTRIAFRCLKPGGNFVLKIFECLHPATRDLISQLTRRFQSVSMIKPVSSRRTNSERYLVCRVFDGKSQSLDDDEYVHATAWNGEYNKIVCDMAEDQLKTLSRIIESVS